MIVVLGVDGTKDGWVAIRLIVESGWVEGSTHRTLASLADDHKDASVIAVDMPIGLPSFADWSRRADADARKKVGARHSSVFAVFPREVFRAGTYEAAVAISRAAGKPAISRQAYALGPKILEVAEVAAMDDRIHEVHPEVSFAAMSGTPLPHSKKTWAGFQERMQLLSEQHLHVPADLGMAGRASVDDVLDAAAAAWSAARIAGRKASWMPEDASESEPRIWY